MKSIVRIHTQEDDDDHMDIDSGSESDGKGALRDVEVREEPKMALAMPVCSIFTSQLRLWTGQGRSAGYFGAGYRIKQHTHLSKDR